MTDLKRLTEDATTKAAIAVGRDAAKRAVDELLSDKDEPLRSDQDAKTTKTKRWKIVAFVVLGLFLVVGLIGLLLNYWGWFLAAGVVGLVGLLGWTRLRKRLGQRARPVDAAKEKAPAELEPVRVAREAATNEPEKPNAEARHAEAEARARALAEAEAVREHEVDEELAAMKARLKR